MTSQKTAMYVKHLEGWMSDARLYKVDPPMSYWNYDDDEKPTTEYVIVSATIVPFGGGSETYIFPSDSEGEPINMLEMPGSFKGALDHAQALANAGYEEDFPEEVKLTK